MTSLSVGVSRLELVHGDITIQDTEAIVNAANSGLRGGGGVDGAIHRAGGPIIMEECRALAGCTTGDAKITSGGRLPAKYVIHAVGPIYQGGGHGEDELLASAYRRSIEVAAQNGIGSLAFPSISTGVYAFPIAAAARIALRSAVQGLRRFPTIRLIRFVLFSTADRDVYAAALDAVAAEPEA